MVYPNEVTQKFSNLQSSARERGIYFSLSKGKLHRLYTSNRCYYTGKVLNKDNRSLDRMDNTKGYTNSNTVLSDKLLNLRKGELTPKQIEILYKGLVKKGIIKVKQKLSTSKEIKYPKWIQWNIKMWEYFKKKRHDIQNKKTRQ